MSPQTCRILANNCSADALASKNLVAVVPFAATVLSKKTRTVSISPIKVMLWPDLASQYVAVSLTLLTSG